jgi:hypothetical protein
MKRFGDIGRLEVRQDVDDLIGGHAVGHHVDDGGNGDPQAPDAGLATHLPWSYRDPVETHDVTLLGNRVPETAQVGTPEPVEKVVDTLSRDVDKLHRSVARRKAS